MHAPGACTCRTRMQLRKLLASCLSYWQFVPDSLMMEEGELLSKNQLMQKFIFIFPPLAYDSGTPCDEKHRNKNVWPKNKKRNLATTMQIIWKALSTMRLKEQDRHCRCTTASPCNSSLALTATAIFLKCLDLAAVLFILPQLLECGQKIARTCTPFFEHCAVYLR